MDQSSTEFSLLPARCPKGFEDQPLHNAVYQFWFNHWLEVLRKLDGTAPSPADFFRQSWVGVLFNSNRSDANTFTDIIGLFTTTFFNLESVADRSHPYFSRSYEPAFLPLLIEKGARSFMSIEYLTIAPAHRRSSVQPMNTDSISHIHVLLGLALKVAETFGADVSAGPGRVDLKADQKARDFGMTSLETRTFHNVPVRSNFVFTNDIQPCPLPTERALITSLWKSIEPVIKVESSQTKTTFLPSENERRAA